MGISAFYLSAAVAIFATSMVVLSRNAVHALLHLIVSLLATAVIFFQLGAPFAAALEVIVYAGAIMVLMVFVIMILNQGDIAVKQERQWLAGQNWLLPALLCAVLLCQLLVMLTGHSEATEAMHYLGAGEVGLALFSEYVLAVELASMLLLAGLVGAFHLARREARKNEGAGNVH